MKAKKVYEFKRTRKQGLSKQTEIGIVTYTRRKIEEWFNKYFPDFIIDKNYIIKDNLEVIVYDYIALGNSNMTNFPFNDLYMFSGSMLLDTLPNLVNLPDTLKIRGYLSISDCPKLVTLPENLTATDLYLTNSNIEYLPENINIENSIDLSYSKIKELPDNLKLNENLNLAGCKNLTKLPENLTVYGTINIKETNIFEIPDTLYTEREIEKDF